MKLLLDTHTVIWWFGVDEGLSEAAITALNDVSNEPFVSAISAFEIATKYRLGKLPAAEPIVHDLETIMERHGFDWLDVTFKHSRVAGGLQGSHKDPFDRMLIAQSLVENIPLVSNEQPFDAFGVSRLW